MKSLTLLEGAFSHFAFAGRCRSTTAATAAWPAMLARIDGPLTVCFSSHDAAVGRFYPLASLAARDDSAARRTGSSAGAGWAQTVRRASRPCTTPAAGRRGRRVPVRAGRRSTSTASDIVCNGGPPSGAHSDIVHPELTWVVLLAAGLATLTGQVVRAAFLTC